MGVVSPASSEGLKANLRVAICVGLKACDFTLLNFWTFVNFISIEKYHTFDSGTVIETP